MSFIKSCLQIPFLLATLLGELAWLLLVRLSLGDVFELFRLYFIRVISSKRFKLVYSYVWIFFWPFWLVYFLYVKVPLYFIGMVHRNVSLVTIDVMIRRDANSRKIARHTLALLDTADEMWNNVVNTKMSNVFAWCYQAGLEVFYALLCTWWEPTSDKGKSMSFTELGELLHYSTYDDEDDDYIGTATAAMISHHGEIPVLERHMKNYMHQYVPPHPFKATIRLSNSNRANDSSNSSGSNTAFSTPFMRAFRTRTLSNIPSVAKSSRSTHLSKRPRNPSNSMRKFVGQFIPSTMSSHFTDLLCMASTESNDDSMENLFDSFPATPFSRNRYMNRRSHQLDSVMFAVRDQLRLLGQSQSRDPSARQSAETARRRGQLAVFDSGATSGSQMVAHVMGEGVALSCGNHCAMKVGKGLCASVRSTIPIPFDTYVYVEFSITACEKQVPWLTIGLATRDCPGNVMTGSWNRSLGLYSDGQLLVGSCWFPSPDRQSEHILHPGCTVGLLVYLPSTPVTSGVSPSSSDPHLKSSQFSYSSLYSGSEEVEAGHTVKSLLKSSSPFLSHMIFGSEEESEGSEEDNYDQRIDIEASDEVAQSRDKSRQSSSDSLCYSVGSSMSLISSSQPRHPSNYKDNSSVVKSLFKVNVNGQLRGYSEEANAAIDSMLTPLQCPPGDSSSAHACTHPPAAGDTETNAMLDVQMPTMADSATGIAGMGQSSDAGGSESNRLVNDPPNPDIPINHSTAPLPVPLPMAPVAVEEARESVEPTAATDIAMALFPTVSILSDKTKVWCRFCEDDIIQRKRIAIGAPKGCRVYCLDGTLLLGEDEL